MPARSPAIIEVLVELSKLNGSEFIFISKARFYSACGLGMSTRNAISDEEALLNELQRELYAQYERGKYAEALRIAEEIYTMDAVRVPCDSSMFN